MNGSDSDDEDQLHILDTIPEEGTWPKRAHLTDIRDVPNLDFVCVKKVKMMAQTCTFLWTMFINNSGTIETSIVCKVIGDFKFVCINKVKTDDQSLYFV